MTNIEGIPYSTAEFDASGNRIGGEPSVPADTTDLIVVSHGWNNDRQQAEELYTKLFTNFAGITKGDAEIGKRRIAIVGVIWPSKRFDMLMEEVDASAAKAAGAASLGGAGDEEQQRAAAEAAIREAVRSLEPLFAERPEARAALPALEELAPRLAAGDQGAQAEFVERLRGALRDHEKNDEDASDYFFDADPGDVFNNVKSAKLKAGSEQVGGGASLAGDADDASGDATGEAAGLGSFLSGGFRKAVNGVRQLLNYTTYYEMNERAGTVGRNGVGPLIDRLAQALPKVERIHLAGHSFGGRVLSAASAASTTRKLHSLTLMQAAFSHFGFSRSMGDFFRSVIDQKRVAGPIVITHTKNDRAVGKIYPLASRLSGDNATALGDANDQYGGIGSNGAQRMEAGEVCAAAATLLAVNGRYEWKPGCCHNLESSEFIRDPKGGDAHGWVFVPEVAWAISRALLAPAAGQE